MRYNIAELTRVLTPQENERMVYIPHLGDHRDAAFPALVGSRRSDGGYLQPRFRRDVAELVVDWYNATRELHNCRLVWRDDVLYCWSVDDPFTYSITQPEPGCLYPIGRDWEWANASDRPDCPPCTEVATDGKLAAAKIAYERLLIASGGRS